jgi:ComF family protein
LNGSGSGDLLDLLLPSGCIACGGWIRGGTTLVCARCRSRLHPPPWPRCSRCHHPRGTGRADADDCIECRAWPAELVAARYAFVLESPATDLVHALKYEGWHELAGFMANAMSRLHGAADGEGVVVVPVPTTASRLATRGYNQAALLARHVSEALGLPLRDALRRRAGGGSQTSLTPSERRENVRGVFGPAAGAELAVGGRHVLLVDDVLTTGATAGDAARALAAARAATVTLIAFARALPSRPERAA